MGKKLVSLKNIDDLEFVKMKKRDLGIWNFLTYFKNFIH